MKKPNQPMISMKQYLKTHLKELDGVKKRWYMNAMKTWEKEDYHRYEKFHLWMFGKVLKKKE